MVAVFVDDAFCSAVDGCADSSDTEWFRFVAEDEYVRRNWAAESRLSIVEGLGCSNTLVEEVVDFVTAGWPCDMAASATGSKRRVRGIEGVDDDEAVLAVEDVS